MFTETLTQRQALAVAAPTILNNTNMFTGPSDGTLANIRGINMSVVRRVRAVFIIGTVGGAGARTSYDILTSAAAAGPFVTVGAVVGTGGVTTTFPTTPALPVASTVISYEIRADQLPAGKPYLTAAAYGTGATAVTCAILLIGDESGYKPGSDQNATALAITNTVV